MKVNLGVFVELQDKIYRAIECDSYSTIKEYKNSRKNYYKKYIEKDNSLNKDMSNEMILGSLVDFMVFIN